MAGVEEDDVDACAGGASSAQGERLSVSAAWLHLRRHGSALATAVKLLRSPVRSGQMIQREKVCADCWDYWLKELSIKVINEMRLDLSTEQGAETYDNIMKETLGIS